MASVIQRLSAAELVETAIMNEKLAADHYGRLAEYATKADNTEVALFFHDQSNRERGHYNRLYKYRVRSGLGKNRTLGETLRWLSPEADAGREWELNVEMDLDTALRLTEEAEEKAQRFYCEAADDVDDPELSRLFSQLADEEEKHSRLAETLRSRYESKGKIEAPDYDDLGFGFGG